MIVCRTRSCIGQRVLSYPNMKIMKLVSDLDIDALAPTKLEASSNNTSRIFLYRYMTGFEQMHDDRSLVRAQRHTREHGDDSRSVNALPI